MSKKQHPHFKRCAHEIESGLVPLERAQIERNSAGANPALTTVLNSSRGTAHMTPCIHGLVEKLCLEPEIRKTNLHPELLSYFKDQLTQI